MVIKSPHNLKTINKNTSIRETKEEELNNLLMSAKHTLCSCPTDENCVSDNINFSMNQTVCTVFKNSNVSVDIILREFIDYWDAVIENWFYNVIDIDQKPFFNLNFNGKYKFQDNYMPEPYWGDPFSSSIVVINYNPAGGDDSNPFTCRDCANCPKTRMVSYVKQHKYSELALQFPIIEEDPNNCLDFLRKYPGRRWWLTKKEWIDRFVSIGSAQSDNCSKNNENKKPFAIELCGWHSAKWSSNFNQILQNNKDLNKSVIIHFLLPMLAAIKKSDLHLGICVGKRFGDFFSHFGKDVTYGIPLKTKCKYVKTDGLKPNSKERYYRVYQICNEFIINTWSIGSNKHPSDEYKQFEKDLIEAINSMRKTIP